MHAHAQVKIVVDMDAGPGNVEYLLERSERFYPDRRPTESSCEDDSYSILTKVNIMRPSSILKAPALLETGHRCAP